MKRIMLLLLLLVCGSVAFYLYIDTRAPIISWGGGDNKNINEAFTVNVSDDRALKKVCYTMTGGACSGSEYCSDELGSQSFDLLVDPEQCLAGSPSVEVNVTVTAVDTSVMANQTVASTVLTFDNQAPDIKVLSGTRYLKQGGTGVVFYEVGEQPDKTGILLGDQLFKAFAIEGNKYLSFYAHPYNVAPDEFKPRIFATDIAGNMKKIRPGSSTTSDTYRSEDIQLTDNFLESVREKITTVASLSSLEAFVKVNDEVRRENNQKIVQICQNSEPKKLWEGVFLRNQGAKKAGFADSRTYKYHAEVVSQQVHSGFDIAGVNHTNIFAANYGKVVFVGDIGIYGNAVIVDHGYGIHSLYGHLSQATVSEGDYVKKGETIAVSGDTGLAFGDHLHFEIRVNGISVNPKEWFDTLWVRNNIETFLPKPGKEV